ncbi:MAG: hypothetical protein COB02_00810 [Candidatus Cloacimonadota bacterium]|nr:MAG: hypothetical protein COB02_00810 [Candidatus Cloacimonadota bacterium]
MKTYTLLFCNLLIIHQFFYLPNIYDSFYSSKWIIFTCLFLPLYFWYLYDTKSNKDLALLKKDKIILFLFLSIFIVSDLYHKSFTLIHTLGVCTFAYCMMYFYKRTKFELYHVSGVILLLLSFLCTLELLGLSFYQGSSYHLSVLTGNPNLFAASFLFWFYIHRKQVPIKYLKGSILLTLLFLIVSKSRAALLAFFIIEGFLVFEKNRKMIVPFLLLLTGIMYFFISNPSKIEGFSKLEIRWIETKISYSILKENLLFGIGQGNYRKFYFKNLEKDKKTYKSYEDESLLRYIRLSSYSHFTPLSILVSLGLPLGFLFIFISIYLLYLSYQRLEKFEFLALISLVLMSMTYYLFHFGIILVPALVLLSKVMSKSLVNRDFISKKRFFPVVFLCMWTIYWLYSFFFEVNSLKNPEFYVNSIFNNGRLEHSLVQKSLDRKVLLKEKTFLKLLFVAHAKMPDPVTYYNASKYFYKKNEKKRAREYLQKGINILPSYAPFYYARALMQENFLKAFMDYVLALKIDRKHVPSWKNLSILQLEAGYLQEGLKHINNALKFYKEKYNGKNLNFDAYYLELLQIKKALAQKIKNKDK